MKFIKDSFRELAHVVWPSRQDRKKFFIIVVSVLILFGIYLAIFWNIFQIALFKTKELVKPTTVRHILPENNSVEPKIIWTWVIEINGNSTSSWTVTTWTWA